MAYRPEEIEPRWQAYWLEHRTFRSELDPSRPKYYVLDMFPYPSGDGLHVGHPEGYTATDILAHYKRMRGFNVLHPMGWDAFGLPAEQYAIKTGTHPRVTTRRNIENFKRQIQSLGFSYDWSREIDTTDPRYYRWTQWIFQKLYERGLAYEAEVPVNWCPALGTVLANEQVIDGRSERGGHPVERQPMRQWMLRITAYADRLIEDLDELDWPEPIKKMERALRQMAAPTATVLRDRQETKIPARDVVAGDVVILHTGDRIPADGRLIESVNLQIEEAALTGESVPVEKHTQALPTDELPVGDRKNMVYAGTAATYGRGKALIVATGMQTEFGKIAQLLQTVESGKSPL